MIPISEYSKKFKNLSEKQYKKNVKVLSSFEEKLRTFNDVKLIKKYINLEFMSKATTGTFWKKASEIQREKYKAALLKQIVLTIEEHLNTLATLSYKPKKSERRGKKLIYVKGQIEDPNKKKPSINLLWKLAANKNGSFLILDLEIEGISLVSSQKAEAVSILRKNRGNFDILLSKMSRDN